MTEVGRQNSNILDGIGTGYDKEMCLHSKRLKNYFKINRRDETYEGGWAKKAVVFPLKTIYKLGTDVKRGEQVGVFGVKKTTIQ